MGSGEASVLARPAEAPNDVWCWDFTFDRTTAGSPLKWLSIIDEFTRECLTLKVARSVTSEDVIDALAELFAKEAGCTTELDYTEQTSWPCFSSTSTRSNKIARPRQRSKAGAEYANRRTSQKSGQ